jgi:hypothetical protein
MCGVTALADFQTPVRLTPSISSHWSSVSSQNGAWVQMPALAMRMSIFPNSAMPRLTASSSSSWTRTSALMASARLSYASTWATVSSRSSWVAILYGTVSIWSAISTMITSAPSRAQVRAWARPWPREPPVMRATLPSSIPMGIFPSSVLSVSQR